MFQDRRIAEPRGLANGHHHNAWLPDGRLDNGHSFSQCTLRLSLATRRQLATLRLSLATRRQLATLRLSLATRRQLATLRRLACWRQLARQGLLCQGRTSHQSEHAKYRLHRISPKIGLN